MIRRKILALVTIGLVTMSLSACNKPANKVADTTTPQTTNSEGASKDAPKDDSSEKDETVTLDADGHEVSVNPPEPVKNFDGASEKLDTVTDVALYSEFANKTLSGEQVSEAIKTFKGKKMAVLLATPMVMDGTTKFNTLDGNVTPDTPTVGASGTDKVLDSAGNDMSDKLTFVNYNAVLKGTKGKTMIKLDTDHFVAEDGLDGADDSYITNPKLENLTKEGSAENISSYLRMQSYLVKDSKGAVIGIACYATK